MSDVVLVALIGGELVTVLTSILSRLGKQKVPRQDSGGN